MSQPLGKLDRDKEVKQNPVNIKTQQESWREARKQKLMSKLLKANPKANTSTLESLVGLGGCKTLPVMSKKRSQLTGKENADRNKQSKETDDKQGKFRAIFSNAEKTKSISSQLSTAATSKPKGKILIRPTATSLKREAIATEGVKTAWPKPNSLHRSVSFKEPVRPRVNEPARLTIPITPEFAKPRVRASGISSNALVPTASASATKQANDAGNKNVSRPSLHEPLNDLPRRSVSFAVRKSVFLEFKPDQPEKEKVREWLDKRGRSVSCCRHLSCMGYSLQEIAQSPSGKAAEKKSKTPVRPRKSSVRLVEDASADSSVNKRLNETYEKESSSDETPTPLKDVAETGQDKIAESTEPGNAAALLLASESVTEEPHETLTDGPRETTTEVELNIKSPEKSEDVTTDANSDAAEGANAAAAEEVTNVEEIYFEAADNIEELLQAILRLLDQPNYPEEKVYHWLNRAQDLYPTSVNHALFWEVRARTAHVRGDIDGALSIYKEALEKGAEPISLIEKLFDDFLHRIANSLPVGQRTPVAQSLGVSHRGTSTKTPRRPLLDMSQMFQSSTIKYELKIKQLLNMTDELDGEEKIPKARLIATPVRRSMRPKSVYGMADRNKVFYVNDLEELSPTTKEKVEVRPNAALFF